MAQITIYMDEGTLKKIEVAARKEHDSISKWVKKRLVKSLQGGWPEGFFDLFGALRDDDSFKRPEQTDWSKDRKRPAL